MSRTDDIMDAIEEIQIILDHSMKTLDRLEKKVTAISKKIGGEAIEEKKGFNA